MKRKYLSFPWAPVLVGVVAGLALTGQARADWPPPGTIVPASGYPGGGPRTAAESRRFSIAVNSGVVRTYEEFRNLDPFVAANAWDLMHQGVYMLSATQSKAGAASTGTRGLGWLKPAQVRELSDYFKGGTRPAWLDASVPKAHLEAMLRGRPEFAPGFGQAAAAAKRYGADDARAVEWTNVRTLETLLRGNHGPTSDPKKGFVLDVLNRISGTLATEKAPWSAPRGSWTDRGLRISTSRTRADGAVIKTAVNARRGLSVMVTSDDTKLVATVAPVRRGGLKANASVLRRDPGTGAWRLERSAVGVRLGRTSPELLGTLQSLARTPARAHGF